MKLTQKQFYYLSRVIVKNRLQLRNKPSIEKIAKNCYKHLDVCYGVLTITYIRLRKRNLKVTFERFFYETKTRQVRNEYVTFEEAWDMS